VFTEALSRNDVSDKHQGNTMSIISFFQKRKGTLEIDLGEMGCVELIGLTWLRIGTSGRLL
jgi:hypothetical protein